jgi:ABC-type Zn uptake system ZnuABC Zn-binding protein ZnuA
VLCFALASSVAHAGETCVAATTEIVGDVVRAIAGDAIRVTVMMPPGTDPHNYEPRAGQLAAIAKCDLLFINGLGLESFMDRVIAGLGGRSGGGPEIVAVSDGIRTLGTAGHDHAHDHLHDHACDPHVWTDPMNVATWADNITSALCRAFPEHADAFRKRCASYRQQMQDLDLWAREALSAIPAENRRLVTDHAMLGYFAERYGFEQVGMILPNYSTAAEPTARELAALNRAIRDHDIRAIFAGMSAQPAIAERLAQDTGVSVVRIYSGHFGAPGTGVHSYADYVKFNVTAIAEALR